MKVIPTKGLMRLTGVLAAVLAAGTVCGGDPDTPLIDSLIEAGQRIQTMRCDVRREVDVDQRLMTTLSRVWFERGDRLRVETVTPSPNRILVDGESIYKWVQGHEEGVRIPLAEAPAQELLQVRRVPASGEEYLLRLKGVDETALPPSEDFPVRRGYMPPEPHPYTILSVDALGRLARVQFFDRDKPDRLLSQIDFGSWKEVLPEVWVPASQLIEFIGVEMPMTQETLRISGIQVNQPIPANQFDIVTWAKDVRFISRDEMETKLRENYR